MTWLPVVVTTVPALEPVSIAEARAQCAVESDDFDTELTIYIVAARAQVESHTGTKLVTQTIVMQASCFSDLENLPTAPLQSITSVKYLDPQGAEQTLSTDVYEPVLVGLEVAIRLKLGCSWPAIRSVSDAVRVVAVAGYGAAAAVPALARLAMLLSIGDRMANREETSADNLSCLPTGMASLLIDLKKN